MIRPTLGPTLDIDRRGERRADAAYLAELLEAESTRFVLLSGGRPILRASGPTGLPSPAWYMRREIESGGFDTSAALFLGTDRASGAGLFAVWIPQNRLYAVQAACGGGMNHADLDLRELAGRKMLSDSELALVGLAKSLWHWHEGNRCCGRCGAATRVLDGGWKRRCWSCGREHFPRLDPVVIMLVVHPQRDKCLLAHEGRFRPNMFSALAGYIEPGEDIEHAVRREVFEETHIEVDQVRYLASQPWAFPHTLMIGCLAMGRTEAIIPDPAEIVEARWFDRAEALQMLEGRHPLGLFVPGKQAIAHSLIRHFANGGSV